MFDVTFDHVQGPVLSANKKLLAEKLAEEDLEKKVKGEAKKERHMVLNFQPLCFWEAS